MLAENSTLNLRNGSDPKSEYVNTFMLKIGTFGKFNEIDRKQEQGKEREGESKSVQVARDTFDEEGVVILTVVLGNGKAEIEMEIARHLLVVYV